MLQTNVPHILSEEEFQKTLKENENVMICCGRMGPMCIPVYEVLWRNSLIGNALFAAPQLCAGFALVVRTAHNKGNNAMRASQANRRLSCSALRRSRAQMDELKDEYKHVAFRDMEFDAPISHVIRNLPECSNFRGLPFTLYFKNGKVAKATSSIQTRDQITEVLDEQFASVAAK